MVIDIVRVQGGENLDEVLNTPATDEQVKLFISCSFVWLRFPLCFHWSTSRVLSHFETILRFFAGQCGQLVWNSTYHDCDRKVVSLIPS